MGTVSAFKPEQPCVIMAQNNRDNLVALILVKLEGQLIKRLDLCIVPRPQTAKRSGEYPE